MGYIINCRGNIYKIGNKIGRVPKNHDCVIKGFHLMGQKIIKHGKIIFVPKNKPGKTSFFITDNCIEAE